MGSIFRARKNFQQRMNDMIRRAEPEDMQKIMEIYRAARAYMRSEGNMRQWSGDHPSMDLLASDIEKGQLYVVTDGEEIHGAFAFILGEDPTYIHIEGGAWKNDEPYGAIHRIAGDGKAKGIFKACLNFCKTQSQNIRIDTHADNKTMQHLLSKNGFDYCGIIHIEDGSPRLAYQCVMNNS